jgi:hypothetical protein
MVSRLSSRNDAIRVVIPLAIRRRNGRPRILPPEDVAARQARALDPHILKALGRAWAWRRKLESGEAATVGDISRAEKVTDRFVSRTMRLAYLAPEVLERLVIRREPPAISILELIEATYLPWAGQASRRRSTRSVRKNIMAAAVFGLGKEPRD